ncbi:MAG TPA: hypothetical protein VHX65_20690 [Pirellulales bacterium]|jgi:uncharacterized repeat protein (TIGR01451 family)|nr:hypothetical protein [Pirellulales bacterium]
MKRLLVRLSALSLILMLGLIAIARGQRSGLNGSGDPQQVSSDPFANRQTPAEVVAADPANSNASSVRLVSVQDIPSESPVVPPRSVANIQTPANGMELTVHPTSTASESAPAVDPLAARNDPLGLRSDPTPLAANALPAAAPPTNAATSGRATATEAAMPAGQTIGGNAVFPNALMLASATAPLDPSSGSSGAKAGHAIYLGPLPPAASIEVAQAPAILVPPPSAAPIVPSQSIIAEQPPPAGQVPPPNPGSVYAPSAYGAAGSNYAAAAASGYGPPQPLPQATPQPAESGPILAPIAIPPASLAPSSSGMTIGSLRPIDAAANVTSAPDSALSATAAEHPDSKHVESSQSPQLSIEKIAPAEVQVGKTARFELRVRNAGTAAAEGVEVHDTVPQGTQFISSNPPTTQGPDGQLAWSLGELKPGEQTVVQLEMLPVAEGDIRSTATVTFRTEVSVHTLATRPRLALELSAPKQVLIGDTATMTVQISNPGTGTATGIVLSEHVPHGLRHKAGAELEFDVGTLKPGQSRQIELSMSAVEAGHVINSLQARGDAKLHAQARVEFDIVAPALSVAMTGPTRRYLERQATYTVAVSNPGTAPARDVELVTQLPKGMKFVKANNAGHYDPETRTVTWNLEELPPSETGSVTLVAVPIEAGEQRMKFEGKAKQGLIDAKEKTVMVEGLAAVTFDVRGTDEAIEVGGETSYQIHVVNEGSMAAANLQVTALFPPELKPLRAEGPARTTIDHRTVQFEPIARLEPKGEATFRIRAQGIQAGDLRVKVQVQTDDMRQPVTKEENTRVYVDR